MYLTSANGATTTASSSSLASTGTTAIDSYDNVTTSEPDVNAAAGGDVEVLMAGWMDIVAAVQLLVICVAANAFLVVSMSRRRWLASDASSLSSNGYKSSKSINNSCSRSSSNSYSSHSNCNNNNNISNMNNVGMLITLIATVGLVNSTVICVTQMASHLIGNWLFSDTYCRLQGMASNLMALLVVWFHALFAFERYMKSAKPQEHQVTFSKINMQIITLGIFLVLMSAVSGPLYGWGTYAFSKDVHTCQLDLTTPNAISYFVLSTASYVVTPYVIMAYSCSALLLDIHFPARRYQSAHHQAHSSPFVASVPEVDTTLERRNIVLLLTMSAAASLLLQLPKYMSDTFQVMNLLQAPTYDARLLTYVGFWLHAFAVNGSFACVLLLFHGCYSRCAGGPCRRGCRCCNSCWCSCSCCNCCCHSFAFARTGCGHSSRRSRDVALVMTSSGAVAQHSYGHGHGHGRLNGGQCCSCWPSLLGSLDCHDATSIRASPMQHRTGSK